MRAAILRRSFVISPLRHGKTRQGKSGSEVFYASLCLFCESLVLYLHLTSHSHRRYLCAHDSGGENGKSNGGREQGFHKRGTETHRKPLILIFLVSFFRVSVGK